MKLAHGFSQANFIFSRSFILPAISLRTDQVDISIESGKNKEMTLLQSKERMIALVTSVAFCRRDVHSRTRSSDIACRSFDTLRDIRDVRSHVIEYDDTCILSIPYKLYLKKEGISKESNASTGFQTVRGLCIEGTRASSTFVPLAEIFLHEWSIPSIYRWLTIF